MDHVMTDEELERCKDEIPIIKWLGADHDLSARRPVVSFGEYPRQHGFNNGAHLLMMVLEDPDRVLPICQSWFLFGYLEAATGMPFETGLSSLRAGRTNQESLIMAQTPNGPVVRLRPLVKLRSRWDTASAEAFEKFRAASAAMGVFLLRVKKHRKCSMLVLEMLIPSLDDSLHLTATQGIRTEGYDKVLRTRFQKNGWCPSLLNSLNDLSMTVLERISYMRSLDLPFSKHDSCSEIVCTAHDLEPEDSIPGHIEENCRRTLIFPDMGQVRTILESGGIPVLSYNEDQKSSKRTLGNESSLHREPGPKLVVRPFSAESKLMAVSHVWSDGLRGNTETGLLECQIQCLHAAMQALGMNCFWIDALAIPADTRLRKQAIRTMADIYRNLECTLILDKRLQAFHVDGEDFEGMALHLLTSVWMQRVWTLQEVALSRRACVVFANEIKDWSICNQIEPSWATQPLELFALRLLQALADGTPSSWNVDHVARMLNGRSSSKKDDQTLAIAGLLGLDAGPLLLVEGEQRMQNFWLQLGAISSSLLRSAVPRMTLPGFKALPRSLLDIRYQFGQYDELDGFINVTPNGLRGQFYTFDFGQQVRATADHRMSLAHDKTTNSYFRFCIDDADFRQFYPESSTVNFDSCIVIEQFALQSQEVGTGMAATRTSRTVNGIPVFEFCDIAAFIKSPGEEAIRSAEDAAEREHESVYQVVTSTLRLYIA